MKLYIDPDNVYIHTKYKGLESEVSSGYDIALIGLEPDHYGRLDDFIQFNKQEMEK